MAALSIVQRIALASGLAVTASVFAGLAVARRRRFYDVSGRNALITGGGRGLGLEIARQLVRKGANVAICARDPDEVQRALVDLRGAREHESVRVVGEICDLREGAQIDRMLAAVRRELGPIDVLVNNAGSIHVGPLDTMSIEHFEEAMNLHCYAPLRAILGVREGMRERGGGRIANIASIGGVVSVPHLLPYSASKFALVGLSQGMRSELARERILVSTITPGLMRTGSPRGALFKGDHEREYAWFAMSDSVPLLSISARTAARRIVRALELGKPHLAIGLPARVAAFANGVAPGLVTRALTVANQILPEGTDPQERRGFESESSAAPSLLTTLSERAAARNNEY